MSYSNISSFQVDQIHRIKNALEVCEIPFTIEEIVDYFGTNVFYCLGANIKCPNNLISVSRQISMQVEQHRN